MKLNDLILLLECADSYGDETVHARPGFRSAKERLLDAGLVEENPNEKDAVRITMRGLEFVDKLVAVEP